MAPGDLCGATNRPEFLIWSSVKARCQLKPADVDIPHVKLALLFFACRGAFLAERARQAEHLLFEGVVALEGSISGEHGIGFSKARYLGIELSPDEIALMRRVKAAFDPHGILNPGKIFPADDPTP